MSRERAQAFLSSFTSAATEGHLVILSGHATANGGHAGRHATMYGIAYVMDGEERVAYFPDDMVPKARKALYVVNGKAYYVAGYHPEKGYVMLHPFDGSEGDWFDPKPRAYVWSMSPAPA